MGYKVLYRKYRPDDFNNLIGQDYTKSMLINIINSEKYGHAYIFTGQRGTGKTSSAKLFAKSINCLMPENGNPCGKCQNCLNFNDSVDIVELDAASNNGVDDMRLLLENVKLVPAAMKYKVYIIDEVHMLTTQAFNALLLTLEEPPSHVVFILATTDIQKVPITVLSRCQRFDFRPISSKDIFTRLRYISDLEQINISDEAIYEISYLAAGGMRDALSILDQMSKTKDEITVDSIISNFGTISIEKINELLDNFINKKYSFCINFLENVKNQGVYYSIFLEKLINELRNRCLLIKMNKLNYDFDVLYNLILDLNNCLSGININVNPYVMIELTFMKYFDSVENTNAIEQPVIIEKKEIIEQINNEDNKFSETPLEENKEKLINIKEKDKQEEKISEEISTVSNINITNEEFKFKKIRINNTFCGADKKYKMDYLEKWRNFIEFLNINDKYLLSLIVDSTIEVASDKNILISVSNINTCYLINKTINSIESLFNQINNLNVKIVALSNEEWMEARAEYIKNKNNPYSYIDEEEEENLMEENSELEKLAIEIFGSEVIEFE